MTIALSVSSTVVSKESPPQASYALPPGTGEMFCSSLQEAIRFPCFSAFFASRATPQRPADAISSSWHGRCKT